MSALKKRHLISNEPRLLSLFIFPKEQRAGRRCDELKKRKEKKGGRAVSNFLW
jgi:hypothetical protein